MSVSTDAGGSETLSLGLDPSGTPGIDADLGEQELPPPPPSGTFDARWVGDNIGQGLLKDIRAGSPAFSGSKTHEMSFQVSPEATEVTIAWNLPDGVTGEIEDEFGGAVYGPKPMSGSGSIVINAGDPLPVVTVQYEGNDAPIATDDDATTDEDTSVSIDVLANDSDDGTLDPASVTVGSGPSNGSASVDGSTGAVTYTPDSGFTGSDSFTYTVADTEGAVSGEATVSVTVNAVNAAPTATGDDATTDEDTATTIDVLANDADDNALDPASVAVQTAPSNGSTSVDASTGEVTYTPEENFNGSDSFTYTVSDSEGAVSDPATVSITVRDINDAPVAEGDAVTTDEDAEVTVDLAPLTSDVDGTVDFTTLAVPDAPKSGTANITTAEGTITYAPNSGFSGEDTFTYAVADDDGSASNEATITVTVAPVNDLPVAEADNATTDEDSAVLIDVLANDADPDGALDPASVAITSNPSNGSVTVDQSTGAITYTPAENFNGSDRFDYTVADTEGGVSGETAVSVTVTAVNDAPVLTANSGLDVEEGGSVPITTSDLSASDPDDPAADLVYAVTSGPAQGEVQVNGNPATNFTQADLESGAVTYVHTAADATDDSFTFDLEDGKAAGPSGETVAIRVSDVNDAPVAGDDAASTDEDTPVSADAPGLLANDIDADDSSLSITSVNGDAGSVGTSLTLPSGATLTVEADGAYTYDPRGALDALRPGNDTTDTVRYTVSDGRGGTAEGTVAVTVTGVNDAPVADGDSETTRAGEPVTIRVLANDTDPEDTLDPTSVAVADAPERGTANVTTAEGTITYTPADGFTGDVSLTYTVADEDGAVSNAATVSVTVLEAASPPSASADEATTDEDTATTIDVLANDIGDSALVPASVAVQTAPSNGSASVDGSTGAVTYTPAENFNGSDRFTYTVSDTTGAVSDPATVSVTVTPVNDPPVATNDEAVADEDERVVIDVLANDADIDSALDPASVAVQSAPSSGSVSVDASTGDVTYTPAENFNGSDSFAYTVADTEGAPSAAATVRVTVAPVNDAPMATGDEVVAKTGTPTSIDVLANDADPDGALDPASVTIREAPARGTATVNGASGRITYTPEAGFTGEDAFAYTVADDEGAVSNAATVSITVRDTNAPPQARMALSDLRMTVPGAPLQLANVAASLFGDPDGDPLSIAVTSSDPSVLSARVNGASRTVRLTPEAPGTAAVTLSASDGAATVAAEPFTVTVETASGPAASERALAVVDSARGNAEALLGTTGTAATFWNVATGGSVDARFFGAPSEPEGKAASQAAPKSTSTVSPYRWQLEAPGVEFDAVDVRFHLSDPDVTGLSDPASTVILRESDTGSFNAVPTRFDDGGTPADSTDDALVAEGLTELGTFRFGSDSPSNPLPVELTAFTASRDGRDALLTWTTASETNNAGFEVQHQQPQGASYATAGFVEGAGTTTQPQSYRFRVTDLGPGTHRFRLRQVDIDGTETLTEPVTVTVEAARRLALTATGPNPVRHRTQFAFTVQQQGAATVALFNMLGQQVQTLYAGPATPGERRTVDVSAQSLASGVYFVRLRAPSGTRTQRIVVVR